MRLVPQVKDLVHEHCEAIKALATAIGLSGDNFCCKCKKVEKRGVGTGIYMAAALADGAKLQLVVEQVVQRVLPLSAASP